MSSLLQKKYNEIFFVISFLDRYLQITHFLMNTNNFNRFIQALNVIIYYNFFLEGGGVGIHVLINDPKAFDEAYPLLEKRFLPF